MPTDTPQLLIRQPINSEHITVVNIASFSYLSSFGFFLLMNYKFKACNTAAFLYVIIFYFQIGLLINFINGALRI